MASDQTHLRAAHSRRHEFKCLHTVHDAANITRSQDSEGGGGRGGDDDGSQNHPMKGSRIDDVEVECSMCGDVGFREKLFPCRAKGCHRHQHTYCSNWYADEERSANVEGVCNWCAVVVMQHNKSGNMGVEAESAAKGAGGGTSLTKKDTAIYDKFRIGKSDCKSSTTPRTAPGRRYKLVSEM